MKVVPLSLSFFGPFFFFSSFAILLKQNGKGWVVTMYMEWLGKIFLEIEEHGLGGYVDSCTLQSLTLYMKIQLLVLLLRLKKEIKMKRFRCPKSS